MYDPNDDTDVTSGTTDGAQMERTSPPVRLHWARASACPRMSTVKSSRSERLAISQADKLGRRVLEHGRTRYRPGRDRAGRGG